MTRDIPNLAEAQLARLDDCGIVRYRRGSRGRRRAGLKATPKGETQLTPEEKLLRAIFGEKASDVKDTSLRVPTGSSGTVIHVQVFTREGLRSATSAPSRFIDDELNRYKKDLVGPVRIVEADVFARMEALLHGKAANGGPKKLAKGTKSSKECLHSRRASSVVRYSGGQ